jgi:hypothetical protein
MASVLIHLDEIELTTSGIISYLITLQVEPLEEASSSILSEEALNIQLVSRTETKTSQYFHTFYEVQRARQVFDRTERKFPLVSYFDTRDGQDSLIIRMGNYATNGRGTTGDTIEAWPKNDD